MSERFRKILVPTDFSDESRRALHRAVDWLADDGELLVCHVIDDTPMTYGYVGRTPSLAQMRAEMTEAAEEELAAFAGHGPDHLDIATYILHGSPAGQILHLADQKDVDLIVMSTHGRTGLPHMLIGSVTEKVVQKAPCPVFVFRAERKD
jgi:nucleotide-binding universal stress UspA family protein